MNMSARFFTLCVCLGLAACGTPPGPKPGGGKTPNMVVNASWTPVKFAQGDKVTISWSMKNIGDAKAQPRPAYSISATGQPTVHGAPGSASTYVAPGTSTPPRKYVWPAECGGSVRIVADPGNDIAEKNESDNVWEKKMGYPVCMTSLNKPDLAITELRLKVLKKISKNSGQVNITAVATNLGGGTVKNDGWIQLCKAVSAKSYHCLPFKKVKFKANMVMPGDKITVTGNQAFTGNCGDLLASPLYKASIHYLKAYPGQKPGEIDANIANNSLEKNSKTICEQLK